MNPFPIVRAVKTLEQESRVLQAARENNHSMICPTHFVERNGEIIGASSLATVPLVLIWSHTEKLSARDSIHLKMVYDSIMETKGLPRYLVACDETSPYNAHMKRFGFKPFWKTEIFEGGV